MRLRILIAGLAVSAIAGSACGGTDAEDAAIGSSEFDGSAQALTREFEPVPPGSYVVDTLGIPFSLTIGDNWFVQPNSDAFTVLTHPDSFGPGDRDVVFIRPTDLSDPADLADPPNELQTWPVTDIEGWLDGLAGDVVVSEARQVSVGGREALTFDLSLGPDFECGPAWCAAFVHVRDIFGKTLEPDVSYRVWWVDGGDYEPVAVVVGGGPTGEDFFLEAETLLSTIAFSTPEPHPIPAGDG